MSLSSFSIDRPLQLGSGDGSSSQVRVTSLFRASDGSFGLSYVGMSGGVSVSSLESLSVSSLLSLCSSLSCGSSGVGGPFSKAEMSGIRSEVDGACRSLVSLLPEGDVLPCGPAWQDSVVRDARTALSSGVLSDSSARALSAGLDRVFSSVASLRSSLESWIGSSLSVDPLSDSLDVGRKDFPVPHEAVSLGGFSSNALFNSYVLLAESLSMEMSSLVGWKGTSRPICMDDFSGYRLAASDDRVDLLLSGEVVGSVLPSSGGRVSFEGFGSVPGFSDVPQPSPHHSFLESLCLSDSNVSLLREESHSGIEVIYSLRYGNDVLFGVPRGDSRLVSGLLEYCSDARFVAPERLEELYSDFISSAMLPGPQRSLPKLELYFYDGRSVRSELEMDLLEGRSSEVISGDLDLLRRVSSAVDDAALKLRQAAGVPAGMNFYFSDAVCPSSVLRDDVIVITSAGSIEDALFITASDGRLRVHTDYDPLSRELGECSVVRSVTELVSSISSLLLSPENVRAASEEYSRHQSRERSRGVRM